MEISTKYLVFVQFVPRIEWGKVYDSPSVFSALYEILLEKVVNTFY